MTDILTDEELAELEETTVIFGMSADSRLAQRLLATARHLKSALAQAETEVEAWKPYAYYKPLRTILPQRIVDALERAREQEMREADTVRVAWIAEIETLRAENMRLREAVFGVVDRCESGFRQQGMDGPDERMGKVWFDVYKICKAALSSTPATQKEVERIKAMGRVVEEAEKARNVLVLQGQLGTLDEALAEYKRIVGEEKG